MINRVVLVGRLTADPQFRTTTSGKNVSNFNIAVPKRVKQSDGSPDADFFGVQCWGATAEFVNNYLGKGRLVAVDGRLQQRSYVGNDGSQRNIVEVVAESVQGLDRPKDEAVSAQNTGQAAADEYDPFCDD